MKISTTRLETFSDGVIAIVITIMVLQLKVPNLNKESTTAQTITYLTDMLPYFLTYVLSFIMIGIFWTNHHHMFYLLERTDVQLVWLNFLFLFLLSLIPLATSIVGANPYITISPVIYGLVMLLTTLSFLTMRYYSLRKKLMHKITDKVLTQTLFKVALRARTKAIIGAFIYLISIPLAYVNVYLSYVCFLISPIIFFIPEGIENERLAEKVAKKNV